MHIESISVNIKRVRPNADLPIPRYMTPSAAGLDLYADLAEDVLVRPGERFLVLTGVAISLPDGFEAQVRPRSGLALKHGVALVNSPGTIDPDYRGEIGVIVINHGAEPFVCRRGERIAQLVISRFIRAEFREVEELDDTERGGGGFGHTGR